MTQMTLLERLSKILNMVIVSPFFLSLFVISILTLALLIVNAKVYDRMVRLIAAIGYTCIIAFIFIQYGSSVLTLGDNLFDNIFTTVYFPSLISYICMIVGAVLLLIRTMINNKITNVMKFTNVSAFIIIVFLFILTLDVIVKNDIDIYSKAAIYGNESLTVLIQSSMGIFAIWLALLGIDTIIKALIKNSEREKMQVENKSIRLLKKTFEKTHNHKFPEIPYVPSAEDESVTLEDTYYKKSDIRKLRKQNIRTMKETLEKDGKINPDLTNEKKVPVVKPNKARIVKKGDYNLNKKEKPIKKLPMLSEDDFSKSLSEFKAKQSYGEYKTDDENR